MMITAKTKRGAMRRYRALLNAYRRDYAGGGQYGFDWRTLRLNAPEVWEEMKALVDAYDRLPN